MTLINFWYLRIDIGSRSIPTMVKTGMHHH
nr:MAG TPA: hypothetical protein [Caudoviricetes sp.]